uniref:Ankyrin repeat domain-containing protein 20B n=1 Tax=Anthurium amnicola TaxID=1678845 RepID=A0A1D1YXK9_9ARAE
METRTPENGISPEAARELLIEISQSIPDKGPGPKGGPKISADSEVVEDARQLLIAISQSIPDEVPEPEMLPEISTGSNVVEMDGGGGAERYRPMHIPIPHASSPDVKFLPSLESSA